MCGIAGISQPENRVTIEEATQLLEAIEDRGNHACGFSFLWTDADSHLAYSFPVSASRVAKLNQLKNRVGQSFEWVILHTRFTTQGSIEYNGNNHPIIGHGITLTHNGVIRNDEEIFQRLSVNRLHDVDSECISVGLAHKGIQWVANNIKGSMSLAWVEDDESSIVNLFTNGLNPLVYGWTKSGAFVYASNRYHLEDCFDMEMSFNAKPYTHYKVYKGDIISQRELTSKYPKREAKVLARNSHPSTWY